jgi:curved DNA-binding protein CbpA
MATDLVTSMNKGQLQQNPLAELIREVAEKGASGVLRLSRSRAKAVIYCEDGRIVFAASNLRAHRLLEFLKRNQILNEAQLAELTENISDEEILKLLVRRGMNPDMLNAIRANHVSEILRAALMWTEGDWEFDSRVRIGSETRVTVDAKRLLLESTRHLPAAYITSRFPETAERLEPGRTNGHSMKLLPAEGFVLSRVTEATTLKEVLTVSGLPEEETLRAIYGLSMSGLLRRAWPSAQIPEGQKAPQGGADEVLTEEEDLNQLFTRLRNASDHYQVLGVDRQASDEELKNAYHTLARRYHPDRFHQSDTKLSNQIDSAFAQIARAYGTLGDHTSRAAYDGQNANAPQEPDSAPLDHSDSKLAIKKPESDRAESSYQKGLAAAKQNQPEHALRLFAEAASLEPRIARYRAEYGRVLISNPETRRIAEIELKAAIALEPANASYRIMLAELYRALGLRRRAEGEIQRVLAADPKNEAARSLMSRLKG